MTATESYNVWSATEVWADGRNRLVQDWHVTDGGLIRAAATAVMCIRALRHDELQGELLLEALFAGDVDPIQPYLIRDERVGLYLHLCVLPEGSTPGPLKNGLRSG